MSGTASGNEYKYECDAERLLTIRWGVKHVNDLFDRVQFCEFAHRKPSY